MGNRHNKTLGSQRFDLLDYFKHPKSQRQKHYEMIRTIIVEKQSIQVVAKQFRYKVNTIYSLLRDVRQGKYELFPIVTKGPKQRRTPKEIQDRIIHFRRKRLSTVDIQKALTKEAITLSARTIERILNDAGFGKLKRRTYKELGKTKNNKVIPHKAEHLDFTDMDPFNVDCPATGVFFFIPYILESGILDVVKECKLPQSSNIGALQACLSMLFLKLIGRKRLSHIGAYDQEPGLGIFAGLNVLPKPTYMGTYSCRCSERQLMDFQEKIIALFQKKYPAFYKSSFINLDFHSIPHYGDESEMQKVWCGARGRSMKGANTIFAQDNQSNAIVYTRADILRSEETEEIKKFAAYWKDIKGNLDETLVFDCKLTTYKVLDELQEDNVKFITLRKRNASLIKEAMTLKKNEWQRVYIPIPKRKHKRVSVHESNVVMKNCKQQLRQIIIKDHGRDKPTFIITNNKHLPLKSILEIYAKRWRIENKMSELVSFFNLNALSSPIMIRIHFDILWTLIADTLYHVFAQDLRRFEDNVAPTLFKNFINMPGRVVYDGVRFYIKIRKRAHTPILMGVKKLSSPFSVSWLDGKSVEIVWTA